MLSGVILAGGDNRGMEGKNRALLKLGSKTFLERQLNEMRKCCNDLIIVTNDPFPLMRSVDRGVRIITDYYPGKGALSGMHAGLSLAKNTHTWVVGCHMPYISATAAQLMLTSMKEDCDAAIPRVAHCLTPFHGIYEKRCSEIIGGLLDSGYETMTSLLNELQWCEMEESLFQGRPIDSRFVTEVHTYVDYERVTMEFDAANLHAQTEREESLWSTSG
ncbi:molybdenum cofactor guanylyltransferase [Paenibacillus spongiae]|uniref:Molybdenum cofactor guanylyltransferase n=1 Tax=Paenibacillus spongiae TaxID=2909671 RepID=A0ABY5S115_9BACL|nr:molybdenum cofactor guanylyltransferase [Paenibacillus spongiae]UVI27546.1 molybdenum cofactor guanylyltransferase [Paenibacillus spongiae]